MLLKRARAAPRRATPAVSLHTDFNGHSLLRSHGRAADAFGVRWGVRQSGNFPTFFAAQRAESLTWPNFHGGKSPVSAWTLL